MWIVEYWDLTMILTVSNLKIRYKNSVLGFLWSLLNPLLLMIVMLVVFTKLMRFNTANYSLFLLSGLIFWRFFASSTSQSLSSIVNRANLIRKIYFPREILVFSHVLSCAVGFLLEFMVFFFILLFFRIPLSPSMLFVILFLFLEFILVFGIGLALSSLYVLFRDYADIWELTLTILFFLTPIVWPTTIIPKNYLPYILLNPLSQIIITVRSAVLEGTMPSLMSIISSTLLCLLAFIVGYLIFKRIEPKFGREL